MHERDLVKKILKFLRYNGCVAWKTTGGIYGNAGMPDILSVLPYSSGIGGRFLAIECKSKGKKPTEIQKQWLKEFRACGSIAFYVDNWESAQNVLTILFE